MSFPLHTVAETPTYLRDAGRLGLSEDVRKAIVDAVAQCPKLGDEIVGSGGVRKFGFAGRGKGKSGGYRIISAYIGPDFPVYLLAILSKGERGNFSAAEISDFRDAVSQLKQQWKNRTFDDEGI